jgi:GNAT superfamily N-acetyltransferase
MKITIREAIADDATEITGLSAQLGYSMSVGDTLNNIDIINQNPNEIIRVFVQEKKVVGWIHVFLAVRLESASFCEIGGLVVHEQYRRMGIAKQLIDHIKPWCAGKGTNILRVRSNIKRSDAHQFYLQTGFREVKQQKVFEIDLVSSHDSRC